jgi:hypothetical protein
MTAEPSKFIWYELMTPDLKAAEAFYAGVVGWRIEDSGMPGTTYSILKAGENTVGGMMPKPPEAKGMPPKWSGYIYSADVDADVRRAEGLGGKVCNPPQEIPQVGRFAVMADPHGAMFNLFRPSSEGGQAPAAEGSPGHIGWRELHAGDGKAAWDFYSSMFGWTKKDAMDMGEMGVYQLFATGGEAVGGMMTKTPDTPQAHWLYYFNVEAIDAAADRVKAGGGKIAGGPMEVPGGQWIVNCVDPQGVAFALLAPKR